MQRQRAIADALARAHCCRRHLFAADICSRVQKSRVLLNKRRGHVPLYVLRLTFDSRKAPARRR